MADSTDTRSGDRSPSSSTLAAGAQYLRLGVALLAVGLAIGLGVVLANRIAIARPRPERPGASRTRLRSLWVTSRWSALLSLRSSGVARFKGEGFLAGTWVFAPLAPVMAAATSVAAYLVAPEDPAHPGVPLHPVAAVYVGLAAALLGLMLFAYLGTQVARRDHAQMRVYSDLLRRYRSLEARVAFERARAEKADASDRGMKPTKALAEARSGLAAIYRQLIDPDNEGPALRWVLAHGYTGIARDLHRVEEALIAVQEQSEVVGDALHDDLSLEDSGLKNRFTLRRVIRDALPSISPAASDALLRPVPALPQTAALVMRAQSEATPKLSEEEAREALREVRYAINDYRDDIVDSFARGRNRVIWTFIAVALSTHVLLGLGLLSGISKTSLIGIALLYLVGSLIGLFSRLRIEGGIVVDERGLRPVPRSPDHRAAAVRAGRRCGRVYRRPGPGVPRAPGGDRRPGGLGRTLGQRTGPGRHRGDPAEGARGHLRPGAQPPRPARRGDLRAGAESPDVAAPAAGRPAEERDLQRSEPATNASVGGAAPEGGAEDVHG